MSEPFEHLITVPVGSWTTNTAFYSMSTARDIRRNWEVEDTGDDGHLCHNQILRSIPKRTKTAFYTYLFIGNK